MKSHKHIFCKKKPCIGILLCGLLIAHSVMSFPFPDRNRSNQRNENDYTATRFPIVLVHGLAGFDSLAGVIDYFNGIPEALTEGGAEVFVVQVSAANSNEVRGEQLLAQVEEIITVSGAEKVNFIAHSQGSPTARYVAGVRPDLVASVTSVGGANGRGEVADEVLAQDGGNSAIATALFGLIDFLSDSNLPQDFEAALISLSTEGTQAFNDQFPAGIPSEFCGDDGERVVNGVHYFSWGGNRVRTNIFDISDLFLSVTSQALDEPNDGLVSSCSQKLGQVLNVEFRMNHLDEINQVLGLTSAFGPNPVDLYRQQANRLKQAGL